jgi:putative spermidine/putrescine transport system substrate-binding protein
MGRQKGHGVRRLLAAAAIAAIGTASFDTGAHAAEKVVVMTWGGTWLDYMKKHVIEPFEKETGIEVEVLTHQNTMDGLAKLKAQKADLDVDVWATSPVPALLAAEEGISQPIQKETLANAQYLPDALVTSEWVAWYRFFFGVAYDADAVPEGITEWQDLWDPALAGKLAVPSADNAQGKFVVLLSWLGGGDETRVDPAFEMAQKLKPNVATFFKSDTDQDKYLQSGEVGVASFMMVGNFLPMAESENLKFVAPKPYVPATVDVFTLLKGKNTENGLKFIDFALGKQAQTAFAAEAAVLPANREAAVPADLAKYAPPESQYRYVDEKAVMDGLQSWVERWNREIQTR